MRIEYTARNSRFLTSAHTAGQDYEIIVGTQSYDPRLKFVGNRSQALDGTRETDHQRTDTIWQVRTGLIAVGTALDEFLEFIASVYDGQIFVVDFDATDSTEVDPRSVQMDSSRLRQQRRSTGAKYYFFAFDLYETPT